jgi:hypothetical protein
MRTTEVCELGFGTKRPSLGHATLCVLDLIPEMAYVRRADHDWRTGERPPRIQQTRHAAPDMPVGELSRVGLPPLRNLPRGWVAVPHGILPADWKLRSLQSIDQINTEQSRYTT